ncbi:MAG: diacylglycerol kinase family protein [Ruminococcaceae bacterium]|nr:diacylglycerol kinase family protein [Oscillospiraceae bacterium]
MKHQLKSFKDAFKGIFSAFKAESHMRFHLVAAVFVLLFAYISEMNLSQWAILLITIGCVFSAELINTAIENLCDLYSTEHNPLIGKIKDIAAGAVLILAIFAAGVALCLFIFTGRLYFAFIKLSANPIYFLPIGILGVLSLVFLIFAGRKTKK